MKNWLNNQTTRYKNGRLTEEQREKLEQIGMKWKIREKQAGLGEYRRCLIGYDI